MLDWRQRFAAWPLWLQLLVLAGPLLTLQWVGLVRSLERALTQEEALFAQRVQTTGQLIAQTLNGQVRAFDHLLRGLREELAEGKPPGSAVKTELMLMPVPLGVEVHLIDGEGRLAFSTLPDSKIGTDLSDRATYQTHRSQRQDQMVVSEPIRPYADGPWLVHFTRPRQPEPHLGFQGILSLSMPVGAFCNLFEAVNLDEYAVLGLALADGKVLTRCVIRRVDGRMALEPAGLDVAKDVRVELDTSNAKRRLSPIDGIERMRMAQPLASFPLYVYYAAPMQELDASSHALMRGHGFAGAVVSVLLVTIIWGLLLALRARDRTTREAASQLAALEVSQKEVEASRSALQALSAHQVTVREEEGRRIAREIHDELGQRLTVVRMDLAYLARGLPPGDAIHQVGVIKDQIDEALAIARDISRKLQPAGLEVGLSTAVEILVSELAQSLTVSLTLRDDLPPRLKLPDAIAMAGFRIIQEGVTNAIRHARPVHIGVSMEIKDECLELRIEDDGQGLPPEHDHATPTFGLSGMRERAHSVGGSLDIDSAPDRGVSIVARLPLSLDAPVASPLPASS